MFVWLNLTNFVLIYILKRKKYQTNKLLSIKKSM